MPEFDVKSEQQRQLQLFCDRFLKLMLETLLVKIWFDIQHLGRVVLRDAGLVRGVNLATRILM